MNTLALRFAARMVLGAVLGAVLAWSGPAVALEAPAPVYFSAAQVDSLDLLPSPPEPGSAADHRDLQAVLDRQKVALMDGTLERAVADSAIDCRRVADVLPASQAKGEGGAALGPALDFATRASLQAAAAVGAPKRYWHRPRPYMASPRVVRRADVAPGYPVPPQYAKDRDVSSYPSGHTAFGTACAIVLSLMVPEQRVALFERARTYGDSREVVGAHYPTDVEAGRIVGTAAAALMLANPQFQADLKPASAGLRAALGLPPEVPALVAPPPPPVATAPAAPPSPVPASAPGAAPAPAR